MIKQPRLYNGLLIGRKYKILRRVHTAEAFEVYLTENGYHLVLFFVDPSSMILDSFTIRSLRLGDEHLVYTVFEDNVSLKKVLTTVNDAFNPQGLSAIAGMKALKASFMNDIIEPIRNKEKYEKFKIALPNAILLFGPPGCGKTYFVKKIAEELKFHFFDTSPSTFSSSYIHGTSIKIKQIFDEARSQAPALIFIDEIDSLFPKRENIGSEQNYKQEEINEFLVQINDINEANIILVGATNQPNLLDDALLRTGRFDKLIYVGMPDFESRLALFSFYLRNRPIYQIDFQHLAEITDKYTCSDIEYICNEASKRALNLNQDHVTNDDLENAIHATKPSITEQMLDRYQQFEKMTRN